MRRDDRGDPFDELFRELERMMNDVIGSEAIDVNVDHGVAGFGTDTHVDVHEDDDEIRVIADLPGVEKDDIRLRCDGQVLTISASSERRQYDERIRLPDRVDEESASATYNNGVLEVRLDRTNGSTDIQVE